MMASLSTIHCAPSSLINTTLITICVCVGSYHAASITVHFSNLYRRH